MSARNFNAETLKPEKEGSDRTIRRRVGKNESEQTATNEIPTQVASKLEDLGAAYKELRAEHSQKQNEFLKSLITSSIPITRQTTQTHNAGANLNEYQTETLTINGELRLEICMKSLGKLIKNEQKTMEMFSSGRKSGTNTESVKPVISEVSKPVLNSNQEFLTPITNMEGLDHGLGGSTVSFDEPISPFLKPDVKSLKQESDQNILIKKDNLLKANAQHNLSHRGSLSSENIQLIPDLIQYKHLMNSDLGPTYKSTQRGVSPVDLQRPVAQQSRQQGIPNQNQRQTTKIPIPNYHPPEFKYINRFKTLVLNRKMDHGNSSQVSTPHNSSEIMSSSMMRASAGKHASNYQNYSIGNHATGGLQRPSQDHSVGEKIGDSDNSALPISEKFSKLFEKPRYNLHLQPSGGRLGVKEPSSSLNHSQEASHRRPATEDNNGSLGLIAQKIDSHSKVIEEYHRRKATATPILAGAPGVGLMSTFAQKPPAYLSAQVAQKITTAATNHSTTGLNSRHFGAASTRSKSNPHSGYLDMFRSARPSPRTTSRGVKSINSSNDHSQNFAPRSLITPTAAALVSKLCLASSKQVYTSPVSSVPQSTKGWKKTEVYSYLNASKHHENYVVCRLTQ